VAFQHSDRSAADNGPKGTGPRLTVTNPTYWAYCVLGWGLVLGSVLIGSKPLLVFAACVALFRFANAPGLPGAGKWAETALMSACIVAAHAVMLPMALLVANKADALGAQTILILRAAEHLTEPAAGSPLRRPSASVKPASAWTMCQYSPRPLRRRSAKPSGVLSSRWA
jgi:hypothetical protein